MTKIISRLSRPMSAFVKVFGCRPLTEGGARMDGRRRKTSKGGNEGSSSRAMGI
jgi:hypothetical protein